MRTATFLCILVASGCAPTTKYTRKSLSPGELTWSVTHGRISVTKDGASFGVQSAWRGLPGALSCVPQAHTWARTAETRATAGRALTWSSAGIMLASVAAPVALMAAPGQSQQMQTTGLLGGAIALGVGLTLFIVGVNMEFRATGYAIDAINVYRDQYDSTDGQCP